MDVLKLAVRPDVVGDLYRSMWQNSACLSFNPGADPLLAQTACLIAGGRARPSIPEYLKVSRQLQSMFEAVISGSAPVQDITRRTAEFVGVISSRDV